MFLARSKKQIALTVHQTSSSLWFAVMLTCSLLATGCEEAGTPTKREATPTAAKPAFDMNHLLNRTWHHSYEEQQDKNGKEMIFRAKVLPIRRFRMAYRFMRDGTCKWRVLSPSDGHYFENGTWTIDQADAHVIHITQNKVVKSFRIVALTEDLLRIIELQQTLNK